MNKIVQIAVADDHPVIVEALYNELAKLSDMRVAVLAETGDSLLSGLKEQACDIIVSDFTMQISEREESDGFGLISRIRQEHPGSKIIIYTAMSNSAVVKRLYRMGIFSVISKKEKTSELIGLKARHLPRPAN